MPPPAISDWSLQLAPNIRLSETGLLLKVGAVAIGTVGPVNEHFQPIGVCNGSLTVPS